VVSTDSAARRCSAGHALAGIAIATVTSLRHRPTTDSGTDIATLVRRALAEVCTISVLLSQCMVLFAGKTVRSMPERFECTTAAKKKRYINTVPFLFVPFLF